MGGASYQCKFSKHHKDKKKSTTQLPQRLLDELYNKKNKVEPGFEVKEGSSRKRKVDKVSQEGSEVIILDKRKFAKKFVNRSASRKEKRKEERKNKKQRVQPLTKQAKQIIPKIKESESKPKPKSDTPPTKNEINPSKSKKIVETSNSPKISREEIEEDRYLRSLEKKLKIKDVSKLSKSKSFIEDGLDELLSGIAVGSSKLRKDKSSLIEYSDDSGASEDLGNELFEGAHYYSTRNIDNDDVKSDEESVSESETSDVSQDSFKSEGSPKDDFSSKVTPEKTHTKYVPPHLRNSEDKLVKLRRLLQGLLNKLGESNIESILFSIDGFYLDYSRNSVTTTLTELILLSVKNRPVLHDSFVIVNAALVAGLYRIIGTEAAAHFTQTLVEQLLDHHKKAQDSTSSSTESDFSKLCVNLTTLVAELYNLGVVSCVLIYSLIRFFLESLDDLNIELLLKTIRAIGPSLRQDDPSAMKDIIIMAQKVAADRCNLGARYKFMMEVLIDLKNNKLKKSSHLATQAALSDEMVRRMKTMLKNLEKQRQIMGSEPLQVSIQDILNASEKGKWWLVGSAWKGNEQPIQASTKQFEQYTTDLVDSNNPNSLLRLAREQSMSTDMRKRIFTVLMSSEDFSDAYERLMKLGLTEKQQRDIPRVVLHCCGNEKTYNPFYSLVAASLNSYSTSYKITFQYVLWDFLRELGETGVGGLASSYNSAPSKASQVPVRRILNSAKFFAYLLSKLSLPLTVLKSLSFTSLQSRTKLFLQLLLAYTLLQADDTTLSTQVAKLADLADLRQGLSFFLHHFIIPSEAMVSLSDFDLDQVSSKGKFLAELLLASD